jgi:RNA polymerase sigma factor (sigma-70 family)
VAHPTEDELATLAVDATPRLMLLLMRRFGLPADVAAEAVQDAFVTVLSRDRATLPEDRSHLFNYLVRTAISRASDRYRSTARRRRTESALWAALHDDPEARLIGNEHRRLLHQAIEGLKLPYRDIFTLLVHEELPLVRIAARLGISPKSIYKQYERGVTELRKHFRHR